MENWYVLKTKPNREFMVRDQLGTRAIETYLPLWRPAQPSNSSKKLRPYFPSYLFAKVDFENVSLSSVAYLPGVNHILMCDDRPVQVGQAIIDGLCARIRLLENSVTDATGKVLVHGDRIKISSGVFEGYDGIFDKCLSDMDHVRILIDFLQKRIPLTIERNLIQKQGSAFLR